MCGAGAFWQDGTRLFSDDNNFRNTFTSALVPEDWLTDSYWGSWLVGEWVGLLIAGICVVSPLKKLSFGSSFASALIVRLSTSE